MDEAPPPKRPVQLNMAAASRREPLAINVQGATAKQLARAIFAAAKPPDPSKRRQAGGRK